MTQAIFCKVLIVNDVLIQNKALENSRALSI